MDHIEQILNSRFLWGRLDSSGLRPSPEDESSINALPPGIIRDAATRLRDIPGAQPGTRFRALMELYAIARGDHQMIVRSIKLAGWRCYLEEVEIGPFDDGLNIIYAPNATGKSTLFEALRRGLLDGHKVTGKDVESIRPWGRQLAPKVTVEFSHAEDTVQNHKAVSRWSVRRAGAKRERAVSTTCRRGRG